MTHRTPQEIRDERDHILSEAKAAGKKANGKKIGDLRLELIASLESEVERLGSAHLAAPNAAGMRAVYDEFERHPGAGADDGHAEAERRFMEKCAAELVVDVKKGSISGIVKDIFNLLDAKMMAYRISSRILRQIGPGKEWPQFTALGLSHETGEPLHDHSIMSDDWIPGYRPPAKQPQEAPPAPEAPDIPITETTAQLPIGGAGMTELDRMAAQIAAAVNAPQPDQGEQKPEDVAIRVPETV